MNLDDQLLDRLETLSSVRIGEEKREAIKQELSDIVDFVEVLNGLDVSQMGATFTTLEGGTPMEDDTPRSHPDISQSVLDHAPRSEEKFFIVPKIIE